MRTVAKSGLALAVVVVVFGCAQNKPPQLQPHIAEAASIMQVGYGPSARFVTCPLSGCSRSTPKTMVEPPSAEAAPVQTSTMATSPSVLPTTEAPKPETTSALDKPSADAATPPRTYIRFPERSARLTDEAKHTLDQLAPYIAGAQQIVIKGRTDQQGDVDSNDRLALRRALAVYEHLKHAHQANDTRFKLLAKGACCYVASNNTEDGRAENRRAEIDFVLPVQASVAAARRTTHRAHSS